jgi:NAD(P)-dependent dehydrogenase (short-subunit alcohol dehydrogenase family)
LSDREIRSTFQALDALGVPFEYHSLDVRDNQAFGDLIQDIYNRYGHINAVIHGAGIIEDKLIADKTLESFNRVYDTKVSSALTLTSRLKDDVQCVVFLSSVSGVFGNRGQADYAAAGDELDKLAWRWTSAGKTRVVSIDWGPWASTGMVSDQLAREYDRRGIGLIQLEEGIESLLREMAAVSSGEAQVIIAAADPSTLDEPSLRT